jgi:hypothetical protein
MKNRRYLVCGVLLVAAAGGLLWWSPWVPREPVFQGKPISYWVGDGFTWTSGPPDWKAIREIEGDAIPCLIRRVNARPSPLDRSYTYLYLKLVPHLPTGLTSLLPHPHTDANFNQRRFTALMLLALIGDTQRANDDRGEPSRKTPISVAIPSIRTALGDTNGGLQIYAALAAGYIGPPAAAATADLTNLAWSSGATRTVQAAVEALGQIGPAASNAAPLLAQILNDVKCFPGVRRAAVVSIAQIGRTPEEAVPGLAACLTNPPASERLSWRDRRVAAYAALALWNRDPKNAELRAAVAAAVVSPLDLLLPAPAWSQYSSTLEVNYTRTSPGEAVYGEVLFLLSRSGGALPPRAALFTPNSDFIQGLACTRGPGADPAFSLWPGGLIRSLGGLGYDAAEFVPEIRAIVSQPPASIQYVDRTGSSLMTRNAIDPQKTNFWEIAALALRKIQGTPLPIIQKPPRDDLAGRTQPIVFGP